MSSLPEQNQCNVALDDDSIPETIILDDPPEGGSQAVLPGSHSLSAGCDDEGSLVGTQAETLREVDELHQGLQKGVAELGVGSIVLTYDQKVAAKTLGHKLYTDEGKKVLDGWDRVLWKNRKECDVVDWAFGQGSPVETLDSVRTDSEIRNAVRSSGWEHDIESGEGNASLQTPVEAPSSAQKAPIDLTTDGTNQQHTQPLAQQVQDKTVSGKPHGKGAEPASQCTPSKPRSLDAHPGCPSGSDTPGIQSERKKTKLVSAWDLLQSNQQEAQQEMDFDEESPAHGGGGASQPILASDQTVSEANKHREDAGCVQNTGSTVADPSELAQIDREERAGEVPAEHHIPSGVSHLTASGWRTPPKPTDRKPDGTRKPATREHGDVQEAHLATPPPATAPASKANGIEIDAIPDSGGGALIEDLAGRADWVVGSEGGLASKPFRHGKAAPRLRTTQERQKHQNKMFASSLKKRAKVLGSAGTRGELATEETAIGLVRKAQPNISSGNGGNGESGKPGLWHRVLSKGGTKDGEDSRGLKSHGNVGKPTLGGMAFVLPEFGSDQAQPGMEKRTSRSKGKPSVHPSPRSTQDHQAEDDNGGKRGSERGRAVKVHGPGLSGNKELNERGSEGDLCDPAGPLEWTCSEFSLNPIVLPAPGRGLLNENDWKTVRNPAKPSTPCKVSKKSPMSLKATAGCCKTPLGGSPPSRSKGFGGLMTPSSDLLANSTATTKRGQELFAGDLDGEPGNLFAGLTFVVTGFGGDADDIHAKLVDNGGTIVKSCGGPCAEERAASNITFPDVVVTFKGSRTTQYLTCVSRGCGAVTPKWIDDCMSSGKLVRADPMAGHVVMFPRPHLRGNAVFEGVRVYIHGDDKFRKALECVLQHAGAISMTSPENPVSIPQGGQLSVGEACVEVIITREIPQMGQSPLRKEVCSLQRLARRLGIPVKDKDWAVSSILEGFLDLDPLEATPKRQPGVKKKGISPASVKRTPPSRLAASKSPKSGNVSGKRRKGTTDSDSNLAARCMKKQRLAKVSESPSADMARGGINLEAQHEADGGGDDSLSTRDPKTPVGMEQVHVAETPDSTPSPMLPPSQSKWPCIPSDLASCRLKWIGNPTTHMDDDGVALHRDFYQGFLLRGKEIKVSDFVELFPAPGENRARVVRLEALWSERPQGGEERMLARCRRFYWPQEVCVPVESLPNEVFSTDHIEDMVSLRAVVQKCSVKLMDVHDKLGVNSILIPGSYKCRLHYHQNEGTVSKTRMGLWK